ncbi:MAG TPA: hypothetical protein QGF58_26800 [Myxococcota bacterium]|nr:hypothetical protein [Myxococcota bacterium]
MPPEVAPIRSLLMAHPDPAGALTWLAENDELAVVRTRATELLALFDEPVEPPVE